MRIRPDWQPAHNGVMLYVPAPRVSIDDTRAPLSQFSLSLQISTGVPTQQSHVSDSILPGCKKKAGFRDQDERHNWLCGIAEHGEDIISQDDSSDASTGTPKHLTTDSSCAHSHEAPDLMAQLIEHAAAAYEPKTNTGREAMATHSSPVMSPSDHGSDRAGFLSSPDSPLLHKSQFTPRRHVTQHRAQFTSKMPPIRRLDLSKGIKKSTPEWKSPNRFSLENLRDVERSPRHKWDEDEKLLLCVMKRWYRAADGTAESVVFAKVFNAITELNLRPPVIHTQFNDLRRKATIEYDRVFDIPFEDPHGRYVDIRMHIERQVKILEVGLEKRECELISPSVGTKFKKLPKIRMTHRELVRRVTYNEMGQKDFTGRFVQRNTASTGMAMRADIRDDWEIITDAEKSPVPAIFATPVPRSTTEKPHLAFRVWDNTNRTKFANGRFISETLVDWSLPLPAPIALDDPTNIGKLLAYLHLSKQGDTPVFISTITSLLQALVYATDMQQPRIALINLNASSLKEENKTHHAAEVLRWLRSQDLARWARYKGKLASQLCKRSNVLTSIGLGEYFVWADIPNDAILQILDYTDLIQHLNDDPDCRHLLNLEIFEPGSRTKNIAAKLRENGVVLNTQIARALGKTAKAFGVNQPGVSVEHLSDFVARIVDGWSITKADCLDKHTMSSLAATFATTLGPHAHDFTVQSVMAAFIDGIEKGTQCIAHWSRSGSGSRRQRFRNA